MDVVEIVALRCPVCGAPLAEDASKCKFCGSVVFIKSDFIKINREQLNRTVINEHSATYRNTVRRDPNDQEAHYGLGVAYFNLGLLNEAADELVQSARLMPENPHIQTQLAVVYAKLAQKGKPEATANALDRIGRALLLDPQLPDALIPRARLADRWQDWNAAIEDLRKAAKSDPGLAEPKLGTALVARARQLLDTPRWTEGMDDLQEAAKLNPTAVRQLLNVIILANQWLLTDRLLSNLVG